MKIAITGGAGFIGRKTMHELLSMGHEVGLWDILQRRVHPTGKWPTDVPKDMYKIRADVIEHGTWHSIMNWKPDAILHLAAYQDYQNDYSRFFTTNVVSTALLYETARTYQWDGIVVVAGSQASLGEGSYACDQCTFSNHIGVRRSANDLAERRWSMLCPDHRIVMEPKFTMEEDTFPVTPYGVSKLAEEEVALKIGRMLGIESISLRYSIVQGAGQSPFNAYSGVLRATALQILAGRDSIILFEDGRQLRDFVAVEDVVSANIMALTGRLDPFEAYNVGSGKGWSLRHMAAILRKIADREHVKIETPGWYRVGDVRHTISDVNKLISCGWIPEASQNMGKIWTEYWRWLQGQDLDAGRIWEDAINSMKASGTLQVAK